MATHDDASPPLPAALGPYTIQQRIAVGGMSEVYLAFAPRVAGERRVVVVKRMLPRVAADPALRRMFSDEASLGGRIKHPNVVEVVDFFEDGQGQPALAMEYVRGVDLWRLARWLTRTGSRLQIREAVYIATAMLRGLAAVHAARDETGQPLRVVHRDVSPSNVLLSIHGDVKLGDLGIAQAAARDRYPSADGGARAKGKLGYLAPEQVRGQRPDPRSDLFSAAVVTAELLMGRPLFAGGSELAVLLSIRDSKIHPFVEYARDALPAGLAAAVESTLSAEREDRPSSAEALIEQLEPYLELTAEELRAQLAEKVEQAFHDVGVAQLTVPASPTQTAKQGFDAWSFQEARAHRTQPAPARTYRITTVGGQQLGPWPLAQVVEAVSTGQLGPFDKVTSSDRPGEELLSDVPELARHVPVSTLTTAQGNESLLHSGALVAMHAGGIVGVLANAAIDRFSGLLLCEHENVRKEVYLDTGRPTFVTSNQASELLGEHLVARGVITRAELDMALAVMPRFEGRLGDTLAGLGLVAPVTLFRHIGEQIREKLLGLFLWPDGSCTQYIGVAPPRSSFPLRLRPWDVIEEGLMWRLTKGMDDALLRKAKSHAAVAVQGPHSATWAVELPKEIAGLYAQLQQPRVPASLWSSASGEQRMKLQRGLLVLLHMGAVHWVD